MAAPKCRLMKKTLIIIVLFLIFLPPLILVTLLLHGKYHTYGRTYQATLDRIGWQMTFTEQNADTILNFTFSNMRMNQHDSLSMLIHNQHGSVVSFTFIEDVDTVFIRNKRELKDWYPPEEQIEQITPEWYVPQKRIIGDIPTRCRLISFSDSCFFSYDKEDSSYNPKSSIIHVVTLYHETDWGNAYYLWDRTSDGAIGVQLCER